MAGMADLKDRLRADLTASIKARDGVRSSTLRMVLTAITNAEVAGKEARELSDDEVVGVLSTEAKKRREAATAFDEGGRAEMAAKERAEAVVIADYLPEQLSEEEIVVAGRRGHRADRLRGRGHEGDGQGDGRRPAAGQGPRRRRRRGRGGPPPAGLSPVSAHGRAPWPPCPCRRGLGFGCGTDVTPTPSMPWG